MSNFFFLFGELTTGNGTAEYMSAQFVTHLSQYLFRFSVISLDSIAFCQLQNDRMIVSGLRYLNKLGSGIWYHCVIAKTISFRWVSTKMKSLFDCDRFEEFIEDFNVSLSFIKLMD